MFMIIKHAMSRDHLFENHAIDLRSDDETNASNEPEMGRKIEVFPIIDYIARHSCVYFHFYSR